MLRSLDHIVIVVRDLAQASADYDRAGFTVTPGGEHTSGATHNALVAFGDGAYFELIAFHEPERPQEHRWWSRLAQGEGFVDYALLSDNLARDAERLRAAGLAETDLYDGGRRRPDGQQIAWRSQRLGASNDRSALPFLIQDVTPRALRVPGGPVARHALPVTRVAGLTLAVGKLVEAGATMAALLGTEGQRPPPSVVGARDALCFQVGPQWLELVQPAGETDEVAGYLRDRGEGPFEVVLSGDAGARPGEGELLPLAATHGARIRVVR
jgi:hypothetical protein